MTAATIMVGRMNRFVRKNGSQNIYNYCYSHVFVFPDLTPDIQPWATAARFPSLKEPTVHRRWPETLTPWMSDLNISHEERREPIPESQNRYIILSLPSRYHKIPVTSFSRYFPFALRSPSARPIPNPSSTKQQGRKRARLGRQTPIRWGDWISSLKQAPPLLPAKKELDRVPSRDDSVPRCSKVKMKPVAYADSVRLLSWQNVCAGIEIQSGTERVHRQPVTSSDRPECCWKHWPLSAVL